MDYNTALDYINSFINFEKIPSYSYISSFNLERMLAFLQELGNPHRGLRTIHVAGTKGKGSACIMISNILKHVGYRVGLYTSPHLNDLRERIRILDANSDLGHDASNGRIREGRFVRLTEEIRPHAERFRAHKELGRLSFFEFLTALCFLYFKEEDVDFIVLETGLGGRLDATNVTDSIVCGITNISKEHTDKLGDSLAFIAREKAGIIKRWNKVVSARQDKEVIDVIKKTCEAKKADLLQVGTDIIYSITQSDIGGQRFDLNGPGYSYRDLWINLLGEHQIENAALSIAMVNTFIKIDEESLRAGLKDVIWPGRLQIIQKEPYIVLDGAQNAMSIKRALLSIKQIFGYKKLLCVFGACTDKDIEGMSKELEVCCNVIILTKSRNERAESPFKIKRYFYRTPVKVSEDVETALSIALHMAKREDLILVTGSLYIVGESLALFQT